MVGIRWLVPTMAVAAIAQGASASAQSLPIGQAPAPFSSLRYHYVPRTRLPLPSAVTIPAFTAKVARPTAVAPTSSLPDVGTEIGTRLGTRVSPRIGTRTGTRLGGGTDAPSSEALIYDPRDGLERKRNDYDRPK